MQRVKVYRLTSEGQWDDKGTGQVSVEYMEVSDKAPISEFSCSFRLCTATAHNGCDIVCLLDQIKHY